LSPRYVKSGTEGGTHAQAGQGDHGAAVLIGLAGCAHEEASLPPEGNIFLTIAVRDRAGPVPGCLVALEPLFGEPASVTPASGTSDAQGRVELVQPQGTYEATARCPGSEPAPAVLVDIETGVSTEVEVSSST
jgi:hypothetical protein